MKIIAEITYNVRVVIHGGVLTIYTHPDDKTVADITKQEAAKLVEFIKANFS